MVVVLIFLLLLGYTRCFCCRCCSFRCCCYCCCCYDFWCVDDVAVGGVSMLPVTDTAVAVFTRNRFVQGGWGNQLQPDLVLFFLLPADGKRARSSPSQAVFESHHTGCTTIATAVWLGLLGWSLKRGTTCSIMAVLQQRCRRSWFTYVNILKKRYSWHHFDRFECPPFSNGGLTVIEAY